MNKIRIIFLLLLAPAFIQSCQQKKNKSEARQETFSKGSAVIAADESFKPIVDQELDVFTHLSDSANLKIIYKPENDVLRLLMNDSVREVVLSRDLTADEKAVVAGRRLPVYANRVAIDAVTLIVNQASKDTLITVSEIKKMLAGQSKTGINVVFDNANSSLARYLKEFSGVNSIKQKNIYALENNKEVLNYVDQHQNAIGIIGLSWLDDPDADYAQAVKNVKVMWVKDENGKFPKQYFLPSQNTLILKQYPLTRGLYIINCTGKMGLATGFAHFLLSDKGQRIVMLSNMLPDQMPEREIQIKHK